MQYKNHPSINTIKEYNRDDQQFFFTIVAKEDIIKELLKLNPKRQYKYQEKFLRVKKIFLRDISMFSLMMQLYHPNFLQL